MKRVLIFFKKGSGEAVAFTFILPFIFLLLIAVIATGQVSTINQNLSACAYNACRSAVVSPNYAEAIENANNIYDLQMGTGNYTAHGYTPCEIVVIDGGGWAKGAYVKCTVRYYIVTPMPFTSGVREQSIVMMVENGG